MLIAALGALLALAGALTPSDVLVSLLRGDAPSTAAMLSGATLFRIGLVVLGLAGGAAALVPRWRRAGPPETPPPAGRGVRLALLGLLVVAAALRLHALGRGLWYDEILTFTRFARMPFGEIVTTYDSQNQHFLYSLLAHASFLLFGESSWAVRLPSALFGVGSIAALYALGRRVTTARETLLACAILTFSYHHIWFSQNARGYSGMLFWTLVSSLLLVRACREPRPRLWVLYAAAAAAGVYTHMTMLFVILGHFAIWVITLVARRREPWPAREAGFFLGFCLAGLLVFQLHALILPQLFGGTLTQGAESHVSAWKNPLWTLLETARGLDVGGLAGALPIAVILGVVTLGIVGYRRDGAIVLQLLLLPAGIGAALTMAMGHPLWPRFFFFTAGFGALVVVRATTVAGRAAARVLRLGPARAPAVGTALCAAGILVSAVSLRHVWAPKQDFEATYRYVQTERRPGDAVVTVGVATLPFERLYGVDWPRAESVGDLDEVRSGAPRTWLIYTLPLHLRSVYPELMETIEHDFHVERRFPGTVGGGTLVVCRSDGAGSVRAEVAGS